MKVFSGYEGLPTSAKGAVVALGNFDGVHHGHIGLLQAARAAANARSLLMAVLTFEPHPRAFFHPNEAPFRLTTAATKAKLLEANGVDILCVLDFDADLAAMSADDFQDRVLGEGLGAKALVAGANFRFGHNREGTLETLAARDPHLAIITPTPITDRQGRQVSSTLVREALTDGRPDLAADLLGRHWTIDYTVETGDRRGRTLGYPTANGRLGTLIRPAYGIYAVTARMENGRTAQGAANIGVRPMWQSDQPLVETYLFDFDKDIYGQILSIALVDYLRPEAKFADIDTLKQQMAKDCDQARQIIAKLKI